MSRHKAFVPGTPFVPGAERVMQPDTNGIPVPAYEAYGKGNKKVRPAWRMPRPDRMVSHFRNAGVKKQFESGDVLEHQAKVKVPVYRGYDRALVNYLRSQERRQQRKAANANTDLSGSQVA